MKICGIVCEYNPFHNGHLYQIEQIRQSGADAIICVMSGNFVQRGEPAFFSKWVRVQAALQNGANLVIENPVIWSLGSAQRFARSACFLLDALGVVDEINFGSECGETEKLLSVCDAIRDERVNMLLKQYIGSMNYPSALTEGVRKVYGEEMANLLLNPNDVLGIEYMRALKELNSTIRPTVTKRTKMHDIDEQSGKILRNRMTDGLAYSSFVPPNCLPLYEKELRDGFAPCSVTQIERAILSKLRTMEVAQIKKAPDVTQGLENRIAEAVKKAGSLQELYSLIKSKRYPLAKIRRIVMNLYLDITKEAAVADPPYIRILGADAVGKEVLRLSREKTAFPFFTRVRDLEFMSEFAAKVFETESRATDLFMLSSPNVRPCKTEMTQRPYFISSLNTAMQ